MGVQASLQLSYFHLSLLNTNYLNSKGCGKTLLARKLGSILSPARPITIVSGPEIMDKFVGSSEKNLRGEYHGFLLLLLL